MNIFSIAKWNLELQRLFFTRANHQLRFVKSDNSFEFKQENLNRKLFQLFFYPTFQDLCRVIQLWKITAFSTRCPFGFGEISPPPCGRTCTQWASSQKISSAKGIAMEFKQKCSFSGKVSNSQVIRLLFSNNQ